jgi:hypothetical protein
VTWHYLGSWVADRQGHCDNQTTFTLLRLQLRLPLRLEEFREVVHKAIACVARRSFKMESHLTKP